MLDNGENRRAYWAQQMDAAYDFMMRAAEYPVEECGEPIASLQDAVQNDGVKVLFSQSDIVPGVKRLFYFRQSLIEPFLAAAREFNARGWAIVVEDGFRTTEMQKHLSMIPRVFDAVLERCIWEYGDMPPLDLMRRRLAALTAASPKTGTHMSATAFDMSVRDLESRQEINRGKPYLEMSELTPMETPFIAESARRNRLEIRDILRKYGFLDYPFEFWHYNQGDAYEGMLLQMGKPARFGAVHANLETGEVIPVENPTAALNSNAEIERGIETAMQRAAAEKAE